MKSENYHKPVLVEEVIRALSLKNDARLNSQAWYIDATLGNAGHTLKIIKRGGNVLGIEADKEMLKIAQKRLKDACSAFENTQMPYKLVHGNFRDIKEIIKDSGINNVYGIIFDLGVNSLQLTSKERGFSFSSPDSGLDMRMDKDHQKITAADLLNTLREDQLKNLFLETVSTNKSRRLAKAIVEKRSEQPFSTVNDLLDVCNLIFPGKGKLHPATKAFLALRIAVNSELDNLEEALPYAFNSLILGGRLLVISFHSTEDRIVKRFFKGLVKSGEAELISKKPIVPSGTEMNENPRARSAKLRVIEKK